MKSINVEVGGLVSSLSAEGVRRKLLQLPGVHHADVNYVAGSATVHLDEGQLSATRMPPPRPHARRLRPRRPPPMLRTRPTQATLRWPT